VAGSASDRASASLARSLALPGSSHYRQPRTCSVSTTQQKSQSADQDLSLLEKLGDTLSAVSEGVANFITRIFGSSNERYIRRLGYIRARDGSYTVVPGSLLEQVNALEEKMTALSDEELRGNTPRLREKLAQGATLDDVLPEAFAACREAGRRTKNMRHFD